MAAERMLPALILLALLIGVLTTVLAILGCVLIARRIRAIGAQAPAEEESNADKDDDT